MDVEKMESPPPQMRAQDGGTLLLFLDGACEPASDGDEALITSVGAVLVNESGQGSLFWIAITQGGDGTMVRRQQAESCFRS